VEIRLLNLFVETILIPAALFFLSVHLQPDSPKRRNHLHNCIVVNIGITRQSSNVSLKKQKSRDGFFGERWRRCGLDTTCKHSPGIVRRIHCQQHSRSQYHDVYRSKERQGQTEKKKGKEGVFRLSAGTFDMWYVPSLESCRANGETGSTLEHGGNGRLNIRILGLEKFLLTMDV
jgi:hypothetical protein